ncbi:transcription elongation factor, mitochondrial-like isoform X1 [Ornithodoros turicata]|uniref:transcription elongation factor, mitochondrial-like isoform X1 n=1 Tax=Ornithodoros turicata TaxID=34597 RepID=UPI003139B5C3
MCSAAQHIGARLALHYITRNGRRLAWPALLSWREISSGSHYTSEQQDLVLQVLNQSTEKELKKLSIGPASILRIMHHRDENGNFETIDHLLSIKGLQEKGFRKVCDAILHGKRPQEKAPDKSSIIPSLQQERIERIQDVVAIDVTPPCITWAHLNIDKEVLSWQRHKFLDDKARHHLHTYYDAVQKVLPSIPPASLYVVEQKTVRQKQNAENMQIRTQFAIQAMLVALLSHGKHHQPQVVSIKSAAITQIFQLGVGGERVSGQSILREMLQSQSLKMTPVQRASYEKEAPVNREAICSVVLLADAFFHLIKT